MLSLALINQHQSQNYFTKENYYTREKSVENSQWQGHGAKMLGLEGEVDAKIFETLLAGKSPDENQSLNCGHDNPGTKRRAGIDLTFSAPKSLSIAALVGADSRLETSHNDAVTMALKVAEERYAITKTGARNARQNESSGNIIAAKFYHDTSRAKDPQMHTHCVLINAVKRKDGEWRSLQNEELFSNSKLLGLIYQNDLAARVKKLGYEIEVKANGTFELKGYSEEQLRAFSKRREQIENMGSRNQKEARSLVKIDRPAKGKKIDRQELQSRWISEAENLKITHPVAQIITKSQVINESFSLDTSSVVLSASRHATQKNVSFKREKLESFALENNLGVLNWRELQREIFIQEAGRTLIQHDVGRYTTREALETEESILSLAKNGRNKFAPIVENTHTSLKENPWGLNSGQLNAVQLTIASQDQFILWHGVGGSGKTYAMNAVRELTSEQKINLRGFAPSAEAAKVLETEAKIPAQTVASLLANPSNIHANNMPNNAQSNNKNEVWIVDEAGLLSARDSEKLMSHANKQNARVVFVGDTRQLSAVEAGNPFRLLYKNGVVTAELSESRRQKNPVLKTSVDMLANGDQKQALAAISAQIIECKREQSRIQFITNEFIKLTPIERTGTLILSGTNKERDLLTTEIRTVLKKENSIGELSSLGKWASIKTLHARDLSPEELGNAAKMQVGNILIFHKLSKENSIQKCDKYEVLSVDSKRNNLTIKNINSNRRSDIGNNFDSLNDISSNINNNNTNNNSEGINFNPKRHKNSFLVYEAKELEVCQGEKLRWTKNDKQIGLRNGEECILKTLSPDGLQLTTKSGKEINLPMKDLLHLDHNYVNTVFSSQGKTCDRVIISVDKTFSREAMYVALSRARHEAKIITPDKEDMQHIISQSRAKLSALDLIAEENIAQNVHQIKQTQGNRSRHKL